MDFVVYPSKALCDPNTSPLGLCQQPKCPRVICIEILFGNELEEGLRKNDMTIFIFVVRIAVRVMDSRSELAS